jgi:hypothetical protein
MKLKVFFTQIKNKLRRAGQWIAGQATLIGHWIRNFAFVFLTTKSKFRIFEGYGHFWFAKIYADRRYKMSQLNKYCGGKRHYVLPAGDYSLAVVNQYEIQVLKKKGYYKGLDISKILKIAYYVTQHNPKKHENK